MKIDINNIQGLREKKETREKLSTCPNCLGKGSWSFDEEGVSDIDCVQCNGSGIIRVED